MGNTSVVESARQALGPVGAFLPVVLAKLPPVDTQRDVVRRLEKVGYRAAWTNEGVGGKDALVQLSVLLAATDRMTFGTGIANIWAREPQTAHGGAAVLAEAYPDRIVLGLGVGYAQQAAQTGREFGAPLARMRDYLNRMAEPTMFPAPDVAYPRIIAANGPKMVSLGAELADGVMPATLPVEFTAAARQLLGPDKLLVVGLSIVADPDPERARDVARQMVAGRLARPGTYAASVARLGYSAEDMAGPSDRLVDAITGHGGPDAIAARVREHLAAGADHVTLLTTGVDFATGVDQLERIGPAVLAAV
jgi:probable F420-dependent oxidoreductase